MVYNLDWQLKLDGRQIKGGSFLDVASCELIGNLLHITLLDESGVTDSFQVYSNVNIGGKDYLLLGKNSTSSMASTVSAGSIELMGSSDSTNSNDSMDSMDYSDSTNSNDSMDSMDSMDKTLTVVRLFDKTRVCAMDPDRFSSLRNAFLTFLEIGEPSSITTLRLLLNGS